MKLFLAATLVFSQAAFADLLLKPGDAAIHTDSGKPGLRFDNNPVARLGHWSSVHSSPAWGIEASAPAKVEVVVLQGYDGPEGNTYDLTLGEEKLTGAVKPNGDWHKPVEISLGEITIPAGKSDLRIIPQKLVFRAVMDLHGVQLRGDTSALKVVAPSPPPASPFKAPGKGEKLTAPHPATVLRDITPPGIDATIGGIAFRPDGTMVVSTWHYTGSVYFIRGYESGNPADLEVSLFADGLLEPLGIACVGERIFIGQKHELTELIDNDKDGIADEYRCVSAEWPVSSNFHLFTFGPQYHDGKLYLNLAVSINPGGATTIGQPKDRGTCIAVDPDTGEYEVIAAGIRTPNGLLITEKGDIYIADNQGDYLPANKIIRAVKGRFYNNKYEPPHPWSEKDVSPPLVWLPQNEIGNSPTQPVLFPESWAPYTGQLVHGDIHYGGLQRTFIDEVNGEQQGAAFRFSGGLLGGTNRLAFDSNDRLYVGIAGRGGNWGTGKQQGIQQLTYTPENLPFEMLAVRAMDNGMEIEFTKPLAPGQGWDVNAYRIDSWKYVPTKNYGGPKVDVTPHKATSASVSEDRTRVFLEIPGLQPGRVVHIVLHGALHSEAGITAHSGEVFYTLNQIPSDRSGKVLTPPADMVKVDDVTESDTPRHQIVHGTYCISCHSTDGSKLVGPSFKGLLGRKQKIIRKDGSTAEITVDKDYILRGLTETTAEYPEGYQPIMPETLHEALTEEDIKAVTNWITGL